MSDALNRMCYVCSKCSARFGNHAATRHPALAALPHDDDEWRDDTSSAFVRPESMPAGVRWFAEYQPFTPVIDTLRGLLLGTPIGGSAILAITWCAGLALVGYLLARAVYNREPVW